MKIRPFLKLTVVTAKHSTSMNLNYLLYRVQTNTKDLSGVAILKIMKLQNTVRKQITTLAGIRRKLLIEKAG